jgi:hypothetical protein
MFPGAKMRSRNLSIQNPLFRALPVCIFMLGAVISTTAMQAQAAIRKCQDADGNWHYGEYADSACAISSDVSTVNQNTGAISTKKRPPTAEELEAARIKKKEAAQKKAARKKQIAKDKSLVKIYGSEEIIISARDRKLAAIDNSVNITRQLKSGVQKDIESLKKRKKSKKVDALIAERHRAVKSYDNAIKTSLAERSKLEQEYNQILSSFRQAAERLGK